MNFNENRWPDQKIAVAKWGDKRAAQASWVDFLDGADVEEITAQLPGDLFHRIERAVFLGTRGLLVKFREAHIRAKIGEEEFEAWTAAIRPPAIRAQDRTLTVAVLVCKKLLAKAGNVEEMTETNCLQGRVWWGDSLIAQRSYSKPEKVDFRVQALQKLDKTITDDRQDATGAFFQACEDRSLNVWSWNACGLFLG